MPTAMCVDTVKADSIKKYGQGSHGRAIHSRPGKQYNDSVTNAIQAEKLASIAMHGRDEVLGKNSQSAVAAQPGS
jgi:hypothetical protein